MSIPDLKSLTIVMAVLVGCAGCGGRHSSTAIPGTTAAQTGSVTGSPAPDPAQNALVVKAIRSHRLRDGHGGAYFVDPASAGDGAVLCIFQYGSDYRCAYTVNGYTRTGDFTVTASGAVQSSEILTAKAAAKAKAKAEAAVVKAKAKERAFRRKVAARKARIGYCGEILHGEHNGLSIRQVVSYCGHPYKRQHISVPGLTTDYLYYGDISVDGRLYQLAFTNGYLTSVNYY